MSTPNIQIIIFVAVALFVISTLKESYSNQHINYYGHSEPTNQNIQQPTADGLIGLIYPPRAGPLHTNFEYPIKRESCPRPFTAIYDQAPYLKVYGKNEQQGCN